MNGVLKYWNVIDISDTVSIMRLLELISYLLVLVQGVWMLYIIGYDVRVYKVYVCKSRAGVPSWIYMYREGGVTIYTSQKR